VVLTRAQAGGAKPVNPFDDIMGGGSTHHHAAPASKPTNVNFNPFEGL
jgi:hypothetical protein